MAGAKFSNVELNHEDIGRVLVSDEMYAELTRVAEPILAHAQEIAPVETGAYKASLHLELDLTDRAVVRVVAGDADVDYSLAVEAKHATLAVAAHLSRSV